MKISAESEQQGSYSIECHPSVHCEERPSGSVIDTIIIHSMHHPSPSGGDRFALSECKACLDSVELSVHYLIARDGAVWNLVPEEKKAWHAGESLLPSDGRTAANDFSIGIELVGSEELPLEAAQYASLVALCRDIGTRHQITGIFGHNHIAPTRKTDPWNFDWSLFASELARDNSLKEVTLPKDTTC
ncbi:N-acetylmuramoyl-L-alanine amidase [bacterium]|nr:N-acetylmuramoyl-L-alanine amidase [bacterium]